MDLDKNLVRKVTSFRPTDFGTGPVPTRDKPKFHLAVLHFWWFLGLSQKSENRVRKVTSFRPTIFGRPVLSRILATRGCVLSVLDQVRTKFGPWNPEYGPKRDFGKVTSFRPTTFGRPVLSRIPGCGNPGVWSKCPRPSSDQVRALEPGIRAKTGFWKSYIFSPNNLRTSRIVPYSGFQGPNLVRTGPELVRTGPELVRIGPAQVPTWSPVVSCLQSTLTTWLYIVKVAILDMPTHLIRARPKTGFGPKSR